MSRTFILSPCSLCFFLVFWAYFWLRSYFIYFFFVSSRCFRRFRVVSPPPITFISWSRSCIFDCDSLMNNLYSDCALPRAFGWWFLGFLLAFPLVGTAILNWESFSFLATFWSRLRVVYTRSATNCSVSAWKSSTESVRSYCDTLVPKVSTLEETDCLLDGIRWIIQ